MELKNVSSKQENIPQKFYVEAVINQAIKFKFDGEAFVPKEADGTICHHEEHEYIYRDEGVENNSD